MLRREPADMSVMRQLAALALAPFALWNLQANLAQVSHNVYGDVAAKPLTVVAGHGAVVRCGSYCRFGRGWLAFRGAPELERRDVASARMRLSRQWGWVVELRLTPAATRRWAPYAARLVRDARKSGVPDVLVVAAAGQVVAAPVATDVFVTHGTLTLTGFTRGAARALLGVG
jgi:hypothetical protein